MKKVFLRKLTGEFFNVTLPQKPREKLSFAT
jgi:hypothetical protein